MGGRADAGSVGCAGSSGGKVIGVACDHRRDEQVKAIIDTIQEQHGRLHLLVNNAFQVTPPLRHPYHTLSNRSRSATSQWLA
jgi:NAD(P)-dependent dehydrogenase (short-subunit alcohol dehydrogenase family)